MNCAKIRHVLFLVNWCQRWYNLFGSKGLPQVHQPVSYELAVGPQTFLDSAKFPVRLWYYPSWREHPSVSSFHGTILSRKWVTARAEMGHSRWDYSLKDARPFTCSCDRIPTCNVCRLSSILCTPSPDLKLTYFSPKILLVYGERFLAS